MNNNQMKIKKKLNNLTEIKIIVLLANDLKFRDVPCNVRMQ